MDCAVAISGGVDSLMTTRLLLEEGHQVVGIHFTHGYESSGGKSAKERAVRIAEILGIPFHHLNLADQFRKVVVDYFVKAYGSGITPNPCMVCNPTIKFGILLDRVRKLGAEKLATGHYARIETGTDGKPHLLRGVDPSKDQSYFLARLNREQLSRTIFPLGGFHKAEVKAMAAQAGFGKLVSSESQDVCFIDSSGYSAFLKKQSGFSSAPGEIVDLNGKVLGRHSGLHHYTIGQRRGINCPAAAALYVIALDSSHNRLIVGPKTAQEATTCNVVNINWLSDTAGKSFTAQVKVRYRHQAVSAKIIPTASHRATIEFETPQAAVTPGQGAVIYDKDRVLGGGWIEKPEIQSRGRAEVDEMTAVKQPKRFKTITLGCKVNQSESSAISHRLSRHGMAPADSHGSADVCIINTCAVTGKAAMQSRQAVRRAARENPDAKIIVTGCYAQTSPGVFREMETPVEVVPQDQKNRILQNFQISGGEVPNSKGVLFPKPDDFDDISTLDRTRPTLKIQDGCNAFCTYCIVPYARGRSCSMASSDVLANLYALEKSGFHEVVLTGIHLGHYGRDLTPTETLSGLLDQITQSSLHLRIRLSSIEPNELTDRIIEQIATDDRFCNHFHVPLQSGSTSILKRMGRPYRVKAYAERVEQVVRRIPEAGIGADVMVGFPGETDTEFEQCYKLVKSLPVTYLHVFPFSPRSGTPAANYPDQIQKDIMKERAARMRELGQAKRIEFYTQQIGKSASVLVEGRHDRKTAMLKGMTDNYIPVLIAGEDAMMNQVVRVHLHSGADAGYLTGVVEDQ